MKKRIFKIILSCLALTFVYFFLDISDLPAGIGIHSEKINWDIAAIVISNLVVICLYLVTFNVLDNRSIEKDKNQREVALLLLFSAQIRREQRPDHGPADLRGAPLRGGAAGLLRTLLFGPVPGGLEPIWRLTPTNFVKSQRGIFTII